MTGRREDVNPSMLERMENGDFCEAGIDVTILICVRFDQHLIVDKLQWFRYLC